jgi:predicted small metal-binding protein
MKTLACREAGFDCNDIIEGDTDEEVMERATDHAMSKHNVKPEDFTPEFKEKIRRLIASAS